MTLNRRVCVVLGVLVALGGAWSMPARAQVPELALEGASAGMYAATVAGPDLDVSLRIVSQVDKVTANVRVDVSPFRAPSNAVIEPVAVKRDEKPVDPADQIQVPALGSVTLRLSARLDESGIHRGSVTLIYAGSRHTTLLEVTRERPLPSIKVDPVPGSTENHVRVALHETAGRPVVLDRPTLLPLVKVVTTDTSEAAKYKSVDIQVVDGATRSRVGETLRVPALGTVELLVTVRGLPRQGKFDGVLRLANAGDKGAVEAAVTFFRRSTLWLPLFLLGVGTLVAEALRLAGRKVSRMSERILVAGNRDRLQALRRELAPGTTGEADPAISAVLAELDADIADLFDQASAGTRAGADLKSDVGALDGRIDMARRWAQLYRSAETLGAVDQVRPDLTKVADFLKAGGDAAAVAAATKTLAEVTTALGSTAARVGMAVGGGEAQGQAVVVPATRTLRTRLTLVNGATLAVGIVVSILLGLLLLYLPNRTWGTPTDCLTLLLWVIGVQQVAGVAAASSAQALVTKIQGGGTATAGG